MSLRPLSAAAVVTVLVAACGSSVSSPAPGSPSAAASASPPPSVATTGPGATATASLPAGASTPSATTAVPTAIPSAPRFSLTTAAFHTGGVIPARFTCDGRDISPAMAWTGTPVGTKWLVLLVEDPDAGDFAHWIVYAIAPGTTRLAEGAGAANSSLAQGTNDFGRVGYGGPCPPSGSHHYRFTLDALDAPLGLSGTPRAAAVRAALERATILGTASITATYAR